MFIFNTLEVLTYSILAHTIFTLLFFKCLIVLLIAMIFSPIIHLFIKISQKSDYNQNLDELEFEYLKVLNTDKNDEDEEREIKRMSIQVENDDIGIEFPSCYVKSLVIDHIKRESSDNQNKNTTPLLFIHGTYASSLGFAKCIIELAKQFPETDIHAFDLPGFGVSDLQSEQMEQASDLKKMANLSKEKVIDFYCGILEKYIIHYFHNHDQKVILVGHSFGGYISVHFAYRYPHLIEKLTIINSVGIFPGLGEYSNYWAVFFKSRCLHLFFIAAKIVSLLRFIHFLNDHFGSNGRNIEDGVFLHYYLELLSLKNSFAQAYVGKFIHYGFIRCQWTKPCLHQLLEIIMCKDKYKFPVFLIYGENDNIMPLHQGQTILETISHLKNKNDVFLYSIPNASHAPFTDNQNKFCKVMGEIIKSKSEKNEEKEKEGNKKNYKNITNILVDLYKKIMDRSWGYYSCRETRKRITDQYKIFKEAIQSIE